MGAGTKTGYLMTGVVLGIGGTVGVELALFHEDSPTLRALNAHPMNDLQILRSGGSLTDSALKSVDRSSQALSLTETQTKAAQNALKLILYLAGPEATLSGIQADYLASEVAAQATSGNFEVRSLSEFVMTCTQQNRR
jgi:hypothetical protein